METFGAQHLGILHQWHMMIDDETASRIRETYDYEWTDEQV